MKEQQEEKLVRCPGAMEQCQCDHDLPHKHTIYCDSDECPESQTACVPYEPKKPEGERKYKTCQTFQEGKCFGYEDICKSCEEFIPVKQPDQEKK